LSWRPDLGYLWAAVDGQQIANFTTRVPNTAMHYVLQTETSVSGCVPSNTAAGHVLLDWLVVYVPA
jgi:hypothetical protein